MEFSSEFIPLKLADVLALSDRMKSEHARFVQILAVNTDAGVDLVYSFMMDGGTLCNYEVKGVKKTDVVPSITGNFLAAFVFENEIHDLFGVTIEVSPSISASSATCAIRADDDYFSCSEGCSREGRQGCGSQARPRCEGG